MNALASVDKRRALYAIGLLGTLIGLYFLTYTGGAVSTDELLMFDGARSFLHGRRLELAYTSGYRPYSVLPNDELIPQLDVEPMQVYAAVPLIWLAEHLPGVGLVQTAWLLNIFVTALTAVVLFYYAIVLGYGEPAAILGALVFGVATYAWPYSRMFFREPLFTLFILICAYSLERWRQRLEQGRFRIGWLALALMALIAGMLTKSAILLVMPVLLIIAIPGAARRLITRRRAILVVVFAVVLSALLLLAQRIFSPGRSDILHRLSTIDWTHAPEALPAYLLSPGFSIWAFSPALLIGFAGLYRLLRAGRLRQALIPAVFLLSLAVGYSVAQGAFWYGGTGWGPRFLLPATPFLVLWPLPVLEDLIARRLRSWMQACMIGLLAFSVFIQALAVLVAPEQFGNYLIRESDNLNRSINTWPEGSWSLLYNPLVVIAHEVDGPSPIAWIMNDTGAVVIPLCLITAAIGLAVLLIASQRLKSWPGIALAGGGVTISVVLMLAIGLRSYYHDPRYIGQDDVLFRTLNQIDAELRPGDAVILNDAFYQRFFMNYYKHSEPIYAMLDAPGERIGSAQTREIVSDNPDRQAHQYSNILFPRLAERTSRWWFVTEFGPFSPDRSRPTEHFLARHYFPGPEVDFSPDGQSVPSVRLIRFAPISAPPDAVPPWPEHPVGADFGPALLVGYDLPQGDTIKAGSALVVSLLWRHDRWPTAMTPFDYGVNVSLVNQSGAVVQQQAGQPVATFAPMSQWVQGGYYRDNHALELNNVPPGDYQIWLLVYDWSKVNSNLPVHTTTGATPGDHVMLTTIHVTR